jgi:hypothetical protein
MSKKSWVQIALLAALMLIFQGTWALAGTTGSLNGVVTSQDGTPVVGAKVSASSPSESVSTTTDASGHFSFVSLIPDTYTVTASKDNYDTVAQAGVSVFADNTQAVHLTTQVKTKTLGTVTTTATAALVKPGTTSDVYSINAATAAKVAGLGGGGGLDSAYSSIAAVPGVVVPPGQQGWFQTIHIRGGDYDQVGYEFDGVPVLRSYDNYPTTNASALGQQELQVYTGAAPANSESQGLAGYINQVIKTGTYPGSVTADLGIGGPALYNKANIEALGATADRNFSYMVGIGMYDQSPRYVNNGNGADISPVWGTAFGFTNTCGGPGDGATCYANGQYGPNGVKLGGYQMGGASHTADRENVVNLHFGIPHKNDAGKDDIQLLFDTSELFTSAYSSVQDWGGTQFTGGQYGYANGLLYTGQLDAPLPANYTSNIQTYLFPSQGNAPAQGGIPITHEDGVTNGQGIIKLQFQHNMGSNAYFRIYGYTFYSDWLQNSPNSFNQCCIGGPIDYELSNHTRGVSATFADQLDAKNLLNIEVADTAAYNYRDNNAYYASSGRIARLVGSASPKSGICYTYVAGGPSVPTTCALATYVNNSGSHVPQDLTVTTCGGGPCEYWTVENGANGGANLGRPNFASAAITDQVRASDKLLLNVGLRYNRYAFKGSDTLQAPGTQGSARDFWFNAWNQDACIATAKGSVPAYKTDPTKSCMDPANFGGNPLGLTYVPATLTNQPNFTESYTSVEPRFGTTFTINPDNVLRFSYGKYSEPPNAAFEQYNVLQQNLPAYDGANFMGFGFNGTSHAIGPAVSYNTDFSWEHHFANSDASFKFTPFYRTTQNQIQNFFLDQKTNFVSGLNAGKQTASGVELQVNDGDFGHNGFAALFSYTYTHSTIKFNSFSNGSSVLSTINLGISQYNDYTKFCQTNFASPQCGSLSAASPFASPCFTTTGVADPACAATSIANPYYNAPAQGLLSLSASYIPFSTIPGGLNAATQSYITPSNATLVLNYKHDKWAVSPSFQWFQGGFYGDPLQTPGIDPTTCAAGLASPIAGDPRYKYGAVGGLPYDASQCAGHLAAGIPDPVTGVFDSLGAFKQPNQLLAHLQISYEVSSRVNLIANFANLIDTCSGGTSEPWTAGADHRTCAYGLPSLAGSGFWGQTGNFYNPTSTFQPSQHYDYERQFNTSPVQAFLEMTVKL